MIITKTYPLQSISVEEAIKLQFRIVDCMAREFQGHELLSRGDLGVVTGLNQPLTTRKAEKVIAEVFGSWSRKWFHPSWTAWNASSW